MYAGFWLRFIAMLIDGALFMGVDAILKLLSGGALALMVRAPDTVVNGVTNYTMNQTWYGVALCWLYFTLLESSKWQATIGKKLLKLKVTDEAGAPIGFGKANARYWSKILSCIILFIGFVMVGFTKKKQGLHDIIARTLVVRN